MSSRVETFTPEGSPVPIGPYSHIAKAGDQIVIGGVGGVDPSTGNIAGADVFAQARQILLTFDSMLKSVDSDLEHILHIHVYLKEMRDFDEMNRAYIDVLTDHRPARTVIGARELPKPEFLVLMNLSAVAAKR